MIKDAGSFDYCEFILRNRLSEVYGKKSVDQTGPKSGFEALYVNYIIALDKEIPKTNLAAYAALMFCDGTGRSIQEVYYKAPVIGKRNEPKETTSLVGLFNCGRYELYKQIELAWDKVRYFNPLINTNMGIQNRVVERTYRQINGVNNLVSLVTKIGEPEVPHQLVPGPNCPPDLLESFDWYGPLEIPHPVELSIYQKFTNRKYLATEMSRTIMSYKKPVKYVREHGTGSLVLEDAFNFKIGFPLAIGQAKVVSWA